MARDPDRLLLIAHLRDQIRSGSYETQGKLEVVADRLIDEIALSEVTHSEQNQEENA